VSALDDLAAHHEDRLAELDDALRIRSQPDQQRRDTDDDPTA
jgi:hypothetical protein